MCLEIGEVGGLYEDETQENADDDSKREQESTRRIEVSVGL